MQAVVTVETNENRRQVGLRYVSTQDALNAVEALRVHAIENGTADMSMEEIDAIIAECRQVYRQGCRQDCYSK